VNDFYLTHSQFTDPGAMAPWLDGAGSSLQELREAASRMVFHYWGHGDITEHGFSPDRMSEYDLRYADDMLRRLHELDPTAPGADRAPTERIIGGCRDFTVLFLAMARHRAIPARARAGFATYLIAGWAVDHCVAEVWDADERRWRLVEPQFDSGHVDPGDGAEIDLLDVPRDRFIVGAAAWQMCRSGAVDPERYVVAPDIPIPFLRGLPYVRHNLILDLAGLNRYEMIFRDIWGGLNAAPTVDESTASRMDELAALLERPTVTTEQIRNAFDTEELRVPRRIRTFRPPDPVPQPVVLRAD
jgi:hypothetical protein